MFLGPLETILTSRSSQFILVWLLDFLIFFYFSSCWLSCWIEVVVSSFSSTRMDGWRIRKRLPLNTSYFSFSLYRYAIFSPLKETKFEHMLYWNGGPSILFKFWPQSEKIQIRARPNDPPHSVRESKPWGGKRRQVLAVHRQRRCCGSDNAGAGNRKRVSDDGDIQCVSARVTAFIRSGSCFSLILFSLRIFHSYSKRFQVP